MTKRSHSLGAPLDVSIEGRPINLQTEDIVARIPARLLTKEASLAWRHPDLRFIFLASVRAGETHRVPNPRFAGRADGQDNEFSTVPLEPNTAYMGILQGTPRAQFIRGMHIVQMLEQGGYDEGIPPEVIDRLLKDDMARSQPLIYELYGPAPYADVRDPESGSVTSKGQIGRLQPYTLPAINGQPEVEVTPVLRSSFAFGMRGPVQEQAFLVLCYGSPNNIYIKGGDTAETLLASLENAMAAKLHTPDLATEALDRVGAVVKAIVISKDAQTGKWKPMRIENAMEAFVDISTMNVVLLDSYGQVHSIREYHAPADVEAQAPDAGLPS